ncbi:MAG: hypothetical protein EBQ94_10255, partial [Flavobacteriales bacterium]|nr:hypothetical protein [Flavobacteriales bacterium]
MRLLFFCLAILTSFVGYSQAPLLNDEIQYSPDGKFDKVFDHYGNEYSLEDLKIDTTSVLKKVTPFTTCNTGYFKLYLEDGSGFEVFDNNTPTAIGQLHAQRRAVLCQLFFDLSQFITPVNPSTPVNIYVRSFVNNLVSPPSGVGAYSSSVYLAPGITTNQGGGIIDNAIWQTINSGIDPFTNFSSPVNSLNSASASFYHGIIAFNFSNPAIWHQNLTVCPSNLIDLYSTGLHEITHSLGFASLINASGLSKLGASYPYFSRYDTFLKTSNGINLLTNTGSCGSLYKYIFNPQLNTTVLSTNGTNCTDPNLIQFAGSVNKKVYTSTTFDPGSSLSHFEDLCHPNYYPNNSYYVMSDGNYNTSLSGQFYSKRYLKEEERKVLCDLGYKVSNFFGSYPYPNTTQCGGNQIVGVNDGIIVNSGIITYQNVYIMGTGAQVISNFLTNDFNPNPSTLTFECPQSVFGLGSASQLNANQILYTPSASSNGGVDLIRYVPKDLNGNKGNITYIYVYLIKDGCTPSACSNMVNNGDFESSSGCYNLNNGSASKCWTNFRGSSDLFSLLGGCTGHPNYNLPTSLSNPPSPTWNNITTNKFFRGLYGGIDVNGVSMYEGMQNKLNSPLLPGETYVISFKAKMANTNPYYNKTKLVIAGSNGPVFSSTGSLNPLPNLLNEIKVVEI